MGEASASELNPEPIQDLRAMREQSVRRSLARWLKSYVLFTIRGIVLIPERVWHLIKTQIRRKRPERDVQTLKT